MERIERQEMPPKPVPQPPADRRQKVVEWVKAVRADELRKSAGDPGPVLARRLSNSEYNYTIRDLTGVDLKPTKEFPVDPANQDHLLIVSSDGNLHESTDAGNWPGRRFSNALGGCC